jgi:hypothetical protein
MYVPAIKAMATTTSISPNPLSPAKQAVWDLSMDGGKRLDGGFCMHPYCGDVRLISIRQYGFCPVKVLLAYRFCPLRLK